MTEVLAAGVGALALIVPALLAIPYGPRRRAANLHEKVRICADLYALPHDDHLDLRRDLEMEIASDLHLMRLHRKYGSPILTFLIASSGFVLIVLARIVLSADGDTEKIRTQLIESVANMVIVWGGGLILIAVLRWILGISGLRKDSKRSDKELAESRKELAALRARRDRNAEVRAKVQAKKDEIDVLEIEIALHEADQLAEKLRERLKQLKEQGPQPIDPPASDSDSA